MKKIKNYFVSICIVIAMPLSSVLAQNTFSSTGSADIGTTLTANNTVAPCSVATSPKDLYNDVPAHLNITLTIPAAWQSQIVRVDYENESIFSLKNGDKAPAFLFSVTRITGDQWMLVKNQLKGYTILGNKDGFITFVQKADVTKIKGSADAQYHEILGVVDAIVASIRVK